jgi:hypothetical protein
LSAPADAIGTGQWLKNKQARTSNRSVYQASPKKCRQKRPKNGIFDQPKTRLAVASCRIWKMLPLTPVVPSALPQSNENRDTYETSGLGVMFYSLFLQKAAMKRLAKNMQTVQESVEQQKEGMRLSRESNELLKEILKVLKGRNES